MAKPSFKTLWNNYPKSGRQGLFDDIGWSDLADKPTFKNTCAIRMSVCLQKSGIDVKSSAFMKALDGR